MTPQVREGQLIFAFPDDWIVLKYDALSYVRKHLGGFGGGSKAVDIVALDAPQGSLWVIEVKDYKDWRRQKTMGLVDEVSKKMRDSLAGLVVLMHRGGADYPAVAKKLLCEAQHLRIVLHLERPAVPSRLRPDLMDPKTLHDALRRELKFVDNQARVTSRGMANVPWSVSRA
ncbi:MAG: hypothetical protein U5K81_13780 [Trueperaceae bacterium]|nr:hypothetical protein [Trueperaceae bacterium]